MQTTCDGGTDAFRVVRRYPGSNLRKPDDMDWCWQNRVRGMDRVWVRHGSSMDHGACAFHGFLQAILLSKAVDSKPSSKLPENMLLGPGGASLLASCTAALSNLLKSQQALTIGWERISGAPPNAAMILQRYFPPVRATHARWLQEHDRRENSRSIKIHFVDPLCRSL